LQYDTDKEQPENGGPVSPGRRSFGAGLASATALGLLGIPAVYAQTRKKGGTIRVAFVGSPVKLDPHIAAGSEEWSMLRNVYDNLVWVDETLAPKPELAESWESTPDAMTWTFKLRKGVKFHHGKELDAEDVVYTFKRILDPATASPARSVFSMVDRIEKGRSAGGTLRSQIALRRISAAGWRQLPGQDRAA
jgi:peptide/nickel transport system substrate-binding protein